MTTITKAISRLNLAKTALASAEERFALEKLRVQKARDENRAALDAYLILMRQAVKDKESAR